MGRCIDHRGYTLIAFGSGILTQAQSTSERVSHWFYPAGIDRLHALDHREDVVQLRQRVARFIVGDLDAREVRDTPDLIEIE